MIIVYIAIGLLIPYCILILCYRAGWQEIKPFASYTRELTTSISVIIPARNEEENIAKLLTSIEAQSYPKHLYEVIVVDDNSSDNTAAIVNEFSIVKLIRIRFDDINSYKKKAIETGISAATGDLIVTTDADCIVGENWLKTIAAFKEETNAVFIAAPVEMQFKWTLLQTFQSLDFLVLQGITAAAVKKRVHNMCNGANLAYDRNVFFKVNGFANIDHIASGDDMLLMQKIAQNYPGKIFYLLSNEAIVVTQSAKTWKEFFGQRIRWASKATTYNDMKIFTALFLVYFFNCALVALLIAGFWNYRLWWGFAGVLFVKIIVELIFLYPVAKFYGKESLIKLLPLFQPLHIIYTIIAGWLGTFGKYEWTCRKVK
jgi:cellulose synthase/poly-beta-1,6-N-acetylglucosamine synthase-like glycosyltransferase